MRSERARGDQGVSVVEVVVTLALLAVILAIFSSQMVAMFNRVHTASRRSESNDAVRLAIQELDRQVRSGNVIHDPAADNPAGMSLRVYTQSNAPTASDPSRCVQWRIDTDRLQTRSWSTDFDAATGDGWATNWRVVAEHLRNRADTSPAFAFDTSHSDFGQRIVRVSFVVNRDERSGRDVEVTASLTGRNVQFGHPRALCNNVPEDT